MRFFPSSRGGGPGWAAFTGRSAERASRPYTSFFGGTPSCAGDFAGVVAVEEAQQDESWVRAAERSSRMALRWVKLCSRLRDGQGQDPARSRFASSLGRGAILRTVPGTPGGRGRRVLVVSSSSASTRLVRCAIAGRFRIPGSARWGIRSGSRRRRFWPSRADLRVSPRRPGDHGARAQFPAGVEPLIPVQHGQDLQDGVAVGGVDLFGQPIPASPP